MKPAIVWALVGAVLLAALLTWRAGAFFRGADHARRMDASFVPDPRNDSSIAVQGWTLAELTKILADFRAQYGIPEADIALSDAGGGRARLVFPNDIPPDRLCYLVNYLNYPNGFDLKTRRLGVVAHVTLTQAFGAPQSALVGPKASIYVPAGDTEYDQVYVAVQSGDAYVVPFTDFVWKKTEDRRTPATIAGL